MLKVSALRVDCSFVPFAVCRLKAPNGVVLPMAPDTKTWPVALMEMEPEPPMAESMVVKLAAPEVTKRLMPSAKMSVLKVDAAVPVLISTDSSTVAVSRDRAAFEVEILPPTVVAPEV